MNSYNISAARRYLERRPVWTYRNWDWWDYKAEDAATTFFDFANTQHILSFAWIADKSMAHYLGNPLKYTLLVPIEYAAISAGKINDLKKVVIVGNHCERLVFECDEWTNQWIANRTAASDDISDMRSDVVGKALKTATAGKVVMQWNVPC